MKNKNLLFIIIIAAVLAFALLRLPQLKGMMGGSQDVTIAPTSAEQAKVATNTASLALQNVKVRIPDLNVEVQLVDGRAEYENGDDRAYVYMMPDFYEEHETSQGTDMFGIYTVNYGGSGEFFYLGIWQDYNGVITPMDVEPLDDRIKMESLEVTPGATPDAQYTVTVKYMTHGPDQAMVDAPNTPVTKTYKVEHHVFLPDENPSNNQ